MADSLPVRIAEVAAAPQRPEALAGWGALAGFILMAGAQIAVPLSSDDRALSTVVIVGFAVVTFFLATADWGTSRAAGAFAVVAGATFALERVGSTTGFPFGEYHYTGELQPEVGGVPLLVPVAWFAMGIPALALGRAVAKSRVGSVLLGSAALTAWDLFLDPQMVEEGYWVWAVEGAYRGIPWSNYLGWLGSGVVLLAIVDRLLPRTTTSLAFLALYTWWAVMNTVGFIVFFGDPLVGVVGGLAMGACVAVAWRSVATNG